MAVTRPNRPLIALARTEPGIEVDLLQAETIDVFDQDFIQWHFQSRHVADKETTELAPDIGDRQGALARADGRHQRHPGIVVNLDAPVGLFVGAFEGGFQVLENEIGLGFPLGAKTNDQRIEA